MTSSSTRLTSPYSLTQPVRPSCCHTAAFKSPSVIWLFRQVVSWVQTLVWPRPLPLLAPHGLTLLAYLEILLPAVIVMHTSDPGNTHTHMDCLINSWPSTHDWITAGSPLTISFVLDTHTHTCVHSCTVISQRLAPSPSSLR